MGEGEGEGVGADFSWFSAPQILLQASSSLRWDHCEKKWKWFVEVAESVARAVYVKEERELRDPVSSAFQIFARFLKSSQALVESMVGVTLALLHIGMS